MTTHRNPTVDDHISNDYPILCKGRDAKGNTALETGVTVRLRIYKHPHSSIVSSEVHCPHNTGGHGQRCKASHPPGVDKVGEGATCPYSFDIPYALEQPRG